jgi:hypothetical protein
LWGNVELEDFIAERFRRREFLGRVSELLQRDAAVGGVVAADLEYCYAQSGRPPNHCEFDRAGPSHTMVARHSRTD